jgi:hypothetical protein
LWLTLSSRQIAPPFSYLGDSCRNQNEKPTA